MRRLILCFDGTWNGRRRGQPSNVEHLAACFARASEPQVDQVVWYLPGVGTQYQVDRALGGALGLGISSSILAGYRFLSMNYKPGDEVSIFGFSRGAFAARSLANFIADPGLLWPEWLFDGTEAYWKAYQRQSHAVMAGPRPGLSTRREKFLATDVINKLAVWRVPVSFLGVFDTVGALGHRGRVPGDSWHNMSLHPSVGVARHALAIDEHRMTFRPVPWKDSAPGDPEPFMDQYEFPVTFTHRRPDIGSARIKQVWFQGTHSDVGGGSTPWLDADSLSTDALLWMLVEANRYAGLQVNRGAAAIAVGGMGNGTQAGTKSSRWWWSLLDRKRILRQSVRPDPDFDGHNRKLRPQGADGVLVASTTLKRFAEDDGYGPENLMNFLAGVDEPALSVTEPVRHTRGLTYEDAQKLFDEICGRID